MLGSITKKAPFDCKHGTSVQLGLCRAVFCISGKHGQFVCSEALILEIYVFNISAETPSDDSFANCFV
jgi:hypothetical protein